VIKHPLLFLFSVTLGVFGLFYYANFRLDSVFFDLIPGFSYLQLVDSPILLPNWFDEWLPSYMYIIGMSTLSLALIGINKKTYWQVPGFWLFISIFFELMQAGKSQSLLNAGNFEWVDLVALGVGCLTVVIFARLLTGSKQTNAVRYKSSSRKVAEGSVLLIGAAMCFGSYKDNCTFPDDETRNCNVRPIYMSWNEIRDEKLYVSMESQNPTLNEIIELGGNAITGHNIQNFGKIYATTDYLFIVDRFRGVNVFDNRNPEEPRFEFYVEVNGATDIEIKNNVMYINSFMDVVSVSLEEFVIKRSKNVLSYPDVNSWLPESVLFATESGSLITIDELKGVVIGYETVDDKRFYFWDLPL